MAHCIFCAENGLERAATHLAPSSPDGENWELNPACEGHTRGWWDGSDWPDGVGAPAIVAIPA